MTAPAPHVFVLDVTEPVTVSRPGLADDIRQAIEDGELTADTGWALLDDLEVDAWYEAYAPEGAL